MNKITKYSSKTLNVLSIVLEIVCEIVLLPFHIIKAIFDIIETLHK